MRIAIFASYDKAGIVHEYILSYLRYLKEVTDKIIFIADNEAPKSEQNKLDGLADYVQFKRHGEYDFGSYKRGFEYIATKGWLEKTDELILCNDSCFCVCSLKPVFEKMTHQKCDFWGLSASDEIQPHIQSFFLVFKNKVFTSKTFNDFIQSIQKQPCAQQVVFKYEIPLKAILNKAGFKNSALFEFEDKKNPTIYHNVNMLKSGYPLLKKKVFTSFENAKESRRKILKIIWKINKLSYRIICDYYHTLGYKHFPWIIPTDKDFWMNFLFQKKEKGAGKYTIKICRIPVYKRKNKIN